MGNVERRLDDLEVHFRPPGEAEEDEETQLRRAILRAVLDEISSLGASRARNRYRGGTPPTPIQPTDPVGDSLGYPYTYGERTEFAIKRVLERLDLSSESGAEAEEKSEEIVTHWAGWFREQDRNRWNEVEAEGPPRPTPPRY